MTTVILRTKLYAPTPRPDWVPRPHLLSRLNSGADRRLTLISAPAGFGKTGLAAAWVASTARPVAWLSLDENDNDPVRFLLYLVAALREIDPADQSTLGLAAESLLQSPQQPALENLIITLINDLTVIPSPFTLLLDDFHAITDAQICTAVAFLIDNMPPQMHLMLTCRADPALPLPRLRARQQMTHLTVVDLRFSREETTSLLNDIMQLDMAAGDIAHLDTRSEGWIASLQLAAVALRGQASTQEREQTVRAFAGDDRHIMDYLMSEVLHRQPRYIQDFLLLTSVLGRLNVRLCNAVTGQVGSQQILEDLDQANLFVVPLDNKRQWYRYHQLFAEFVQSRLEQGDLASTDDLHGRAGRWYADNGYFDDAIDHALLGKNFTFAAAMIEEHGAIIMWTQGRVATLLRWLNALPAEIRDSRPYLALVRAWSLLSSGMWTELETYLPTLERAIKEQSLHIFLKLDVPNREPRSFAHRS